VGFDPDFQGLIGDEQDDDKQRYFLEIHSHAKFSATKLRIKNETRKNEEKVLEDRHFEKEVCNGK